MALFGEGKGFRVTAAVTGENSVGVEAFARAYAMGGMNGFAPGSGGVYESVLHIRLAARIRVTVAIGIVCLGRLDVLRHIRR